MVKSMNKSSSVMELVEWGKKNKVFVKEFVDLKNIEEVESCISKLKKDKLWEK